MLNFATRFRSPKPWSSRAECSDDRFVLKCKHAARYSPWLRIAFVNRTAAVVSGVGTVVPLFILLVVSYLEQWGYLDLDSQVFDFLFFPAVLLFGTALICGFIAVFCLAIGQRQIVKGLKEDGFQRCPNCYYDLNGRTESDSLCSECGAYTPRRECVRLWCKLLRSRF